MTQEHVKRKNDFSTDFHKYLNNVENNLACTDYQHTECSP